MILNIITGILTITSIVFLLSTGARIAAAIPILQLATELPSLYDLPARSLLNPSIECSKALPLLIPEK